MKVSYLARACSLLAFACFFASSVHAASRMWDGSTDTDYDTTANWSGTDVPDNDDSGILTGGGTGETVLSGGSTKTAIGRFIHPTLISQSGVSL